MKPRGSIEYQYVNISFENFSESNVSAWIDHVIQHENKKTGELAFIFCDDEYLLEMNKQYLHHDYLTDVITFDYCEDLGNVSGDVFISIPRVIENAADLNIGFLDELYRVMVHGVLHLLCYSDKDGVGVSRMREKENYYLSLLS